MRKILFILFIVCTFCTLEANIQETKSSSGQIIEGKFYVEPGTVHVGPRSIFIELDSNYVPVDAVYVDEYGVYINLRPNPKCGHVLYCNRCGGCNPANRCQHRCKCPW